MKEGKLLTNNITLLDRLLQAWRFKTAIPYLKGGILDFGGNRGELKKFVNGKYMYVNYDHSAINGKKFDTIVALAVIEHIGYKEVFKIFKKFKEKHLKKNGKIFLTTPTKIAKPVLDFLAGIGAVNKENIEEHKHYWSKEELFSLAEKAGFEVEKYQKFQLGFNQLAIFKHKQ